MTISAEAYKSMGRIAAGAVSVVTAHERGTHAVVGLTVSSFVTLSFNPPLVMFAIQHDANSYPAMVSSQCFGVSLLASNQADIARRFAIKSADKAVGTTFETGLVLPVPLIAGALAQVECRTNQIFISGDHAILVGLVEAARTFAQEPLLYYKQQFGSFVPLVNAI
ncbi:MAG: flavin reductase family protein [Pseudomonadota bacterium]